MAKIHKILLFLSFIAANGLFCLEKSHANLVQGKKYQCQYCPKAFEKANNLNIHSRIHTGEKPFKCLICSKTDTCKFSIIKHIKSHHENINHADINNYIQDTRKSKVQNNNESIYETEVPENSDQFSQSLEAPTFSEPQSSVPAELSPETTICYEGNNSSLNDDLRQSHESLPNYDFAQSEAQFESYLWPVASHISYEDEDSFDVMIDDINQSYRDFNDAQQEISVQDNSPNDIESLVQPSANTTQSWDLSGRDNSNDIAGCESHGNAVSDLAQNINNNVTHAVEESITETSNISSFNAQNLSQEKVQVFTQLDQSKNKNQCPHCPKSFQYLFALKSHIRIHTGEKPFQCLICSYPSTQKSNVVRHIKRHHKYINADDINNYIQDTSNPNDTNNIQNIRDSNAQSSLPQSNVRHNTQFGQNNKKYACSYDNCEKFFRGEADLNKHIRTHTGEKPFQCLICSHSSAQKSNVEKHIERHHKYINAAYINQYIQDTSNPNDTNNIQHIGDSNAQSSLPQSNVQHNTQSGQNNKKYVCSYDNCEKFFRGEFDLNKHIRTHTGEKPFQCLICSHPSAQKSNVVRHIERHHKYINADDINNYIQDTRKSNVQSNILSSPLTQVEFRNKQTERFKALAVIRSMAKISKQNQNRLINDIDRNTSSVLSQEPSTTESANAELTQSGDQEVVDLMQGMSPINKRLRSPNDESDTETNKRQKTADSNNIISLKGFENKYNSCYLNAVLQCLSQITSLTDIVLKQNSNSQHPTVQDLYKNLLLDLKDSDINCINTEQIYQKIVSKYFNNQIKRHEDAQEFLSKFLADLHKECKDLFNINIVSKVHCNSCNRDYTKSEDVFSLSLSIPNQTALCHIDTLLDEYFKEEELKDGNSYQCDTCQCKTNATKKLSLLSLPNMLAIHIKRFDNDSNKIMTPLAFDNILSLKHTYCNFNRVGNTYQLKGVVYHHGDMANNGHYTAYVKNNDSNWYYCDDKSISKEPNNSNKQAYILFYELADPNEVLNIERLSDSCQNDSYGSTSFMSLEKYYIDDEE